MISEAVDAGEFKIPLSSVPFQKIQIIAVEELLKGKKPDLPQGLIKNYYKEAKATEIDSDKAQPGLGV
jgi:hypothetical protein